MNEKERENLPDPDNLDGCEKTFLSIKEPYVIVIPLRNEAENITLLIPRLEQILAEFYNQNKALLKDSVYKDTNGLSVFGILLLNHRSTDNTLEKIIELKGHFPNIKYCTIKDEGVLLGDLLKMAITGLNSEYIITMDGDLSHPPEYIPIMLSKLIQGYDVVIGGRYGPGQKPFNPRIRYVISKLYNKLAKFLLKGPIHDYTTGYRAFRKDLLDKITLYSHDFNLHPELNMKLVMHARKPIEIQIKYEKRKKGRSKFKYFHQSGLYLKALRYALVEKKRIKALGPEKQ